MIQFRLPSHFLDSFRHLQPTYRTSLDLDVILLSQSKTVIDTGSLVFHAVGDTDGIYDDDVKKSIAKTMDQQISETNDNELVPIFYHNLGDGCIL